MFMFFLFLSFVDDYVRGENVYPKLTLNSGNLVKGYFYYKKYGSVVSDYIR